MSEAAAPPAAPLDDGPAPAAPVRRRLPAWVRWTSGVILALAALLAIAFAVLESPIGHRFIVDRISRYAPASGMRVEIGRFEGSLMGRATLRNVTLSDPRGVFMRVPLVELDWRPLRWFTSGLDVRRLILRRGILYRGPQFNPGDPDAPILPDFDIRIDRFELDRLTVAKGLLGEQRRIDLVAKTDIRKGRVYLSTRANLGGADRLFALLDSEPRADRFAIQLDYNAPRGGLLATLMGAEEGLTARMGGRGGWQNWRGTARVDQGATNLADLTIANRGGRYAVAGVLHPARMLSGLPQRIAGEQVAVQGEGTLVNSVLAGRFGATGKGAEIRADGTIDLGKNRFSGLKLVANVRDPAVLGAGTRIEGGAVTATLDGPLQALAIDHRVTVQRFAAGTVNVEGLVQQGRILRNADRWTLPLNVTARRVVTGNAAIDPRLAQGYARGTIIVAGTRVLSDKLSVGVPGLGAALALSGDTAKGDYRLTGPVAARALALANLGLADADVRLDLGFGAQPWLARAAVTGRMTRVTNGTLTTVAGTGIRFAGNVAVGAQQPLLLQQFRITGSKLALTLDGRNLPGGTTTIAGRGRHTEYGAFTVQANVAADGPRAVLVFASPLPAAGLQDVRVAIGPIPQGFRIETSGQSRLGPFSGTLGLFAPPGGATRIVVERMTVWKTGVTGTLLLGDAGASGTLALAGGGLDGTIRLEPRGGGQGFDAALTATDARFAGAAPLAIANGRLTASGTFAGGHSTISGNVFAEGVQQGSLFVGRLAATANLVDGRGRVTASLAGRRGSRFSLQLLGDIAPDRYAILAGGEYAGQRITMPRRAVLTKRGDTWALAPAQLDFAGGRLIAEGTLGADTRLELAVAEMPLALVDIFTSDLGLGGKASGTISYRQRAAGIPTGQARIEIKGLTRSGLVLTSRPIDVAMTARLDARNLETRAVLREGGTVRGRLQGRIGSLPASGTVADRLAAGQLFAQLRYSGPADALWRLSAVETFDLTGPINVAADVTGTLGNPAIRGSLASSQLRLQSALTGTDIQNVSARGTFAGSQLRLSTFTGRTRGGGQVSGSGTVDLSGLNAGRGPALDIRLAARRAELIARDDMAATVTGPLRIVSDGVVGTVAGRVAIDSARWQLGRASTAAQLPDVKTREINPRADVAPPRLASAPWRYLIDASGAGQITVRGLGLDSEWGADVRIRGTTAAPRILG
ncbi:MAG: translocation/assembly module TamB domain-containing protein, partial [Pseudomonadota bacterium]